MDGVGQRLKPLLMNLGSPKPASVLTLPSTCQPYANRRLLHQVPIRPQLSCDTLLVAILHLSWVECGGVVLPSCSSVVELKYCVLRMLSALMSFAI